MRADVIVLFEPLIDDALCLSGCCKPFGVEDFATQRSVKSLIVSILPGGPGVDVNRLDPDFGQPIFEGFGCKLGAIVGS